MACVNSSLPVASHDSKRDGLRTHHIHETDEDGGLDEEEKEEKEDVHHIKAARPHDH